MHRRPAVKRHPTSDVGLPYERTVLAWERTAFSMMVAGIVLARYAAADTYIALSIVGLGEVVLGGAVLMWSQGHYDDGQSTLSRGEGVVHPGAVRLVGLSTVAVSFVSLVLAVALTVSG